MKDDESLVKFIDDVWGQIREAFKPVVAAMQMMAEQIRAAFERPPTQFAVMVALRTQDTPTEPEVWGEDWQSRMCAAWLHEVCPQHATPQINCRCTCHGGHMR